MKKILIISYYFPPSGGAGVMRWIRFIKEFHKLNYDVTVITTENGDYNKIDKSLEKLIPSSIDVIRTKTPSYGAFYKRLLGKNVELPFNELKTTKNDSLLKRIIFWLRINVIIPDARILWNHYAYKEAYKQLVKKGIKNVIITSPPHSSQLIGIKLKRKLNINLISDYRDPWSDICYIDQVNQNIIAKNINRFLEKKAIQNADQNIIVSDYIKNKFPIGNKITVNNCFDFDSFADVKYSKSCFFRIKYVGTLVEQQDIETIFSAVNLLPKEIKNKIEFSFIGCEEKDIKNRVDTSKVNTVFKGFLPHKKAINEIVNSELLVLLINNYSDNKGMLTMKLFEYLGSGVPIICIGVKDGDADRILKKTKAGKTFNYGDFISSKDFVLKHFIDWNKNVSFDRIPKMEYSSSQQIKKIVELLI